MIPGLLQTLLRVSAGGALTCLVVYAATALLRNRLPKSWQCWLWVAVLLRFLIPLSISVPLPIPEPWATASYSTVADSGGMSLPAGKDTDAQLAAGQITPGQSQGNEMGPVRHPVVFDAGKAAVIVWMSGAAAVFLWSVVGYGLSIRKLRHQRVLMAMSRVPIYESDQVSTPLLAGLVHPVIYVPKGFVNPELAIRHELCHLKRGDLWLKWAIQLAVCIHWFNPLVYLLKHEYSRLSEISCDCAAVRGLDDEARRVYGEMILSTVHSVSGFGGPMATALGKDKRLLKERITEIMKIQAISKKAKAAMAVLVAVVLCAAVISCAKPTGTQKDAPSNISATNINSAPSPVAVAGSSTAPFVNDPDVLGTWEACDNVSAISDFNPAKQDNHDFSVIQLVFSPGGTTNYPSWTWTKGSVLLKNANFTGKYQLEEIGSGKYIVLEVLPDINFPKPYLVLKKISDDTTSHKLTDNIDLPFVDDPDVIGKWTSVYAVRNISDFDPAKSWPYAMYLKTLSFSSGGAISANNQTNNTNMSWTKGAVLNRADQTASAYTIKQIGGATYMFFESKTGDYGYLHMKPPYIVLKKEG